MRKDEDRKGCTITNRGILGNRTHELDINELVSIATAYSKGENIC